MIALISGAAALLLILGIAGFAFQQARFASQRSAFRSRKKSGAGIDRDAMETIIEAALKQDALDEDLADCAVNALGALGLVRYRASPMRAVPTRQLSNLVAKLRIRERATRYAKIEFRKSPGFDGCYVPVPSSGS